jgi:hypothetical protein
VAGAVATVPGGLAAMRREPPISAMDKKDPADAEDPIDADEEWEERRLPVKPKKQPNKKKSK